MSIRNYVKKMGKRAAGAWGRINHKKQMRAESKATRKYLKEVAYRQIDDLLDLEDPEDYH